MAAYLLLALGQLAGLLFIPFGLPGTWVQVGTILLYAVLTDFGTVGWVTIGVAALIAIVAEVVEFLLGGSFARRYGGGKRAMWGAILGGTVGAIVGLPLPIVGSLIGSFVGSFAGALMAELTAESGLTTALRTGWGALLGRLAAVAAKSAMGVAIAVLALFSALSS